ncbi:MAG: transposase [Verrucomicrobia bacterium]|nr:transposase [Verrucomicrobiota bacterium]
MDEGGQERKPLLVTEASLAAANRGWAPLRSRGELPHLFKPGGTYFVTYRLWDAVVPADERPTTPEPSPDDPEAVAAYYEPPLRAGSCVLGRPEVAGIVIEALEHFDGQRYALHAWCVMPNHVHVVVTPADGHGLSAILHTWKSFTAKAVNRVLGRTGALWERESFDHLVRSFASFRKLVDYTVNNPVKAGWCAQPEEWAFSSVSWSRGAGKMPAPQAEATGAGRMPAPQADGPVAGKMPAPPDTGGDGRGRVLE